MVPRKIQLLLTVAFALTSGCSRTEGAPRASTGIKDETDRKSSADDFANCSPPGLPQIDTVTEINFCFATELIYKTPGNDHTTYEIRRYIYQHGTESLDVTDPPSEDISFSLCTLSSVQAKTKKAGTTPEKATTKVVGCHVYSLQGTWFVDVSDIAVCDVMCSYYTGYWKRLRELPSQLPIFPDNFGIFEVSAQDTVSSRDSSVFVTERDSADKETRVCGLTTIQTSLDLRSKGNKFTSGYCKLKANEMRYDMIADPGSKTTSCSSTCVTIYDVSESDTLPRGVYNTDTVHQSIGKFGRLETGVGEQSFKMCFLSHVEIQPSPGYSGSRGCKVLLEPIGIDPDTGSETFAWSLNVTGARNDKSVSCGALCICQVCEDSLADSDQPWCIPPMGLAYPFSNNRFPFQKRQEPNKEGTRENSQPYFDVFSKPAFIVFIVVLFGLLYACRRRMRCNTTRKEQGKETMH